MATIVGNNQVKLNDGKVIQAQEGGWYDGQQLFGGTLSAPGVINAKSNQPGAGQAVSKEVVQQTNPANWDYIQKQQAIPTPMPTSTAITKPSASSSSGDTGGGLGITAPETINLPQLYEGLYSKSGIRETEADLTAKTNAFNEQVAKIKDNPYLSEATMTGRIKKLEDKFRADTALTQNDIAMKKADIETKLNLETKQFDINSQVARDALEKFQTLLSSGSLDGASGEDIASLTRSTGLSSSMIQSAINANKAKNVQTSVIQFDDGTNQGFAVINQQTGEIINTQTVATSKPKNNKATQAEEKTANLASLKTSIKNGITLKSLVNYYGDVLGVEDIYRLYNSGSPNGAANEDIEDVKAGKFNY